MYSPGGQKANMFALKVRHRDQEERRMFTQMKHVVAGNAISVVSRPVRKTGIEDSTREVVIVSGLPFGADKSHVYAHFAEFGEIEEGHWGVKINPNPDKIEGGAFFTYKDPSNIETVLNTQHIIQGVEIHPFGQALETEQLSLLRKQLEKEIGDSQVISNIHQEESESHFSRRVRGIRPFIYSKNRLVEFNSSYFLSKPRVIRVDFSNFKYLKETYKQCIDFSSTVGGVLKQNSRKQMTAQQIRAEEAMTQGFDLRKTEMYSLASRIRVINSF